MDVRTGETYTDEELHSFYTNHTTEEIKEFDKNLVKVEGTPEALEELEAKVKIAIAHEHLLELQDKMRKREQKRQR